MDLSSNNQRTTMMTCDNGDQVDEKACQMNELSSSNNNNNNKKLINEALKRILLDIVIRGHGDRLIGRWSPDPELQKFLDQVPYLLDRINQLHLACTRCEHLELEHVHHHHHHHHDHAHHNQRHKHHNNSRHHHIKHNAPGGSRQSALSDFMHLIGNEMHWLVRTRDPLGLSPLHKAVLYNNRPIVEYIVDRYQNELAPIPAPVVAPAAASKQTKSGKTSSSAAAAAAMAASARALPKLIDAQDKYGRTALHYAAALVNQPPASSPFDRNGDQINAANRLADHLYHYLISKKANQDVEDFRGKRAAYYLENPERLLARSIIYLDNKLNASFQANVLTKTLKAAQERAIRLRELELKLLDDNDIDCNESTMTIKNLTISRSSRNQSEFLSGSCSELRRSPLEDYVYQNQRHKNHDDYSNGSYDFRRAKSSSNLLGVAKGDEFDRRHSHQEEHHQKLMTRLQPKHSSNESRNFDDMVKQAVKNFYAERVNRSSGSSRLDRSTRQQIIRSVQEADFDKLNDFLAEGYGDFLISGDLLSICWNQQCKRYLVQVLPVIVDKVDALHESIVRNELDLVGSMLADEPILARIRRPYRRASMNSLHVAIQYERLQIIYQLVDEFPELIGQRDSNGATCLHYAARSLRLDRLYCWLLEHFGPQLEQARDNRGRTASDYRHHAIRLASLNSIGSREGRMDGSSGGANFMSSTPTPASNAPQMALAADSDLDQSCADALTISGCALELKSRPVSVKNSSVHQKNKKSSQQQTTTNHQNQTRNQNNCNNNNNNPTKQRLETTIFESIQNEDFKTLEHLILANCGQRIEDVYNRLRVANKLSSISESMRDFIENHTPAYRQTIDRVHQILHCCFAFSTSPINSNRDHHSNHNQTATSDQLRYESTEPDVQFLRLNNLLADKRLVMSRDKFGASPLHVSMLRCDNRLIEFLIRRQPEAASAPDLQGRTAFHYAAIVCAAFKQHGTFKLTVRSCDNSQKAGDDCQELTCASGYWLVDSTIEQIYGKLSDRYVNLMSVCDKFGKKPEDYLADNSKLVHVNLCTQNSLPIHSAALPNAAEIVLLEPSDCFGDCCSDYANLLSRYNYLIVGEVEQQQQLDHKLIDINEDPSSQNDRQIVRNNDRASARSSNQRLHDAQIMMQNLPLNHDRTSEDNDDASRRNHNSLDEQNRKPTRHELCADQRTGSFDTTTAPIASSARRKTPPTHMNDVMTNTKQLDRSNGARSAQSISNIITSSNQQQQQNQQLATHARLNRMRKSTNDLLSSLEGDHLWVPGESNDMTAFTRPQITQVAPKPTVGSEAGFPHFSRSPTNLTGLKCDPINNKNNNINMRLQSETNNSQKAQLQTNNSAKMSSRKLQQQLASGNCPPPPPGYVENICADDRRSHSSKLGRYHSKRNFGLSNNNNSDKKRASYNHKSVVGGVIVPSIIHDEKSGEIETYDIIYRQPPSPRPSSSSSAACTISSLASGSSGSHRRHHHQHVHHHHKHSHATSGRSLLMAEPEVAAVAIKTIGNNRRRASNNDDSGPASCDSDLSEPEIQNECDDLSTTHQSFKPILEINDDIIAGGGINEAVQKPTGGANSSSRSESDDENDSLTDDDDDEDDDDYDDRVERLSSEFDLRVTREKNELRAKVDQIMSEIKINSKTIPSSSPIIAASPTIGDKQPEVMNNQHQRASTTSSSTTDTGTCYSTSSCSASSCSSSATTKSSSTSSSSSNKPASAHNQQQTRLLQPNNQQARPSSATGSILSTSGVGSSSSPSTTTCAHDQEHKKCVSPQPPNKAASQHSTGIDSPEARQTNRPASNMQQTSYHQHEAQSEKITPSSPFSLPAVTGSGQRKPTSNNHHHHHHHQVASKNAYGQTYLHFIASQPQNNSTLYKILDHAPHLIGERDAFYRSARDVAVQFNLPENVMIIDEFIIDAFISARTGLLRDLLNQGYSPLIHVSDPDGNDIMLILKLLKLDKMINLLLQMADFQRWRDELHSFIRHGYSAGIHELVRKHQDLVKSKSVHSRTSLHLAVLFDRFDIIDVLIKKDSKCVYETDCMGRTALHYAYALRSQNMARIRQRLIDNGADQEARDVKMRMPKYYSIFTGEIEDIKRIESELN